jgi:small subunit ribosomal protein S8
MTMAVNDPISDYLTRVRNAIAAQHAEVEVPASRLKKEMTRILAEQGYITDYVVEPTRVGEAIRIKLKYTDGRGSVIAGLKRVSRPGRRRYVTHEEIPRVMGGMGTAILSTSTGVMTGHEARQRGVGGEVVAYVW